MKRNETSMRKSNNYKQQHYQENGHSNEKNDPQCYDCVLGISNGGKSHGDDKKYKYNWNSDMQLIVFLCLFVTAMMTIYYVLLITYQFLTATTTVTIDDVGVGNKKLDIVGVDEMKTSDHGNVQPKPVERQEDTTITANKIDEALLNIMEKYDNCTVPPPLGLKKLKDAIPVKSIWFPSFPDSFDEKMMKRVGQLLTGMESSTKSYYSSTKNMKRCKGLTPTALCMLVHPFIQTKPERMTEQFAPFIVMGMRNPLTAIPAHHNSKAIKYHGQVGQVSVDEWREFRDLYALSTIKSWTHQIETWQNLMPSYYQVQLYLAYEHLMDYRRGPETIRKLAKVLKKAGFDTANADDDEVATCIWYKGVGVDAIMQYERYKYEYSNYRPFFKHEQVQAMRTELENLSLQDSVSVDLLQILGMYMTEVVKAKADPGTTM